MTYTFAEFMETEKYRFDQQTIKREKIGEEIQFSHSSQIIHSYQDVTNWFSSFMERYPEIQFIYRYAVYANGNKDLAIETINAVMKQEGEPIHILTADVWDEDGFIPPRFDAAEFTEEGRHCIIPLSNFQGYMISFKEAIKEVPRYALCQIDSTSTIKQSATFVQLKEQMQKSAERNGNIVYKEKSENEFYLLSIGAATFRYTFSSCEHITKQVQEIGVNDGFLSRVSMLEDERVVLDEYRFYFYHRSQLMIMTIGITEEGNWKGLNTNVRYASNSWEISDFYEYDDLGNLKQSILHLVKEEPDVRLHVVTSGLNEE